VLVLVVFSIFTTLLALDLVTSFLEVQIQIQVQVLFVLKACRSLLAFGLSQEILALFPLDRILGQPCSMPLVMDFHFDAFTVRSADLKMKLVLLRIC